MQLRTLAHTLLCTTALFASAHGARAQEPVELDLIEVTILKIRQALSNVAGGVSVVKKEDKDLHANDSVADILAPIPGVSTEESANDPATAINIRGLQDFGRVAVTIDGARQNFQRSGHNTDGMFYFEPEQMQQVTVTRGPIANVYGSGAIGGVVSFDTLDALSFLKEGENIAAMEKLRYGLNGDSLMSSTTGALRLGEYGGILGNIVLRDNGAYKDGDGELVADSDREILAGLAKLSLTPNDETRWDVSYLINTDEFDNGLSATSRYNNEVEAKTLSSKLTWNPKDNDLIDLTFGAYWTSTFQDQERLTSTNPAQIGLHRSFEINTIGTDLFNTSVFKTGSVKHTLTYGVDIFQDKVEVIDPISTADLFTPSGKRVAGGGFIQDQIDLTAWMQLIVAGRYDAYSLKGDTVDSSGSHFSPKGTLVLKPFETTPLKGLNIYGTFAEGYRAPSTTETMIGGFHPPPAPFQFLPNANLKPEVAQNIEAGVTGQFNNVFKEADALSLRAGAFQNKVDDYIGAQYLSLGPPGPAGDTFQYINITKAKLQGLEAELNYDGGWIFGGVAGSIIRGEDVSANQPLLTVPADKVVTTLGFRFLEEKASVGARWFSVADQNRVPTGAIPSVGYNLVNLFATYKVNDNLNLAINADNIFDEDYRRYLDGSDSPGRSIFFTVEARLGQ
jgi:hemoglobin/transferrin/lactoferrin receptor protein